MKIPTFDRIIKFDERSRSFPVRAVAAKKPRSYTWSCKTTLDQGTEGACVGFAWAHELNARPKVHNVSAEFARIEIYNAAKRIDEWEGESYDGTSVLAGAKVVKGLGYIPEYRWGFGVEDLILAVGTVGPAVLGVNWYMGMFQPNNNGLITPSGALLGGHAILCNGVSLKKELFRLHNSWGSSWGFGGECYISFSDMERLLKEDGEACFPVIRSILIK